MEISSIIFTKDQAARFNPLYYDMSQSVGLIIDKDNFLKSKLDATQLMRIKKGAQKNVNWCALVLEGEIQSEI